MKTITLTDEEYALLHEHLIWLYDFILSLSENGSYEQYACNVKSMYKHILDVIEETEEHKEEWVIVE